MIDGELFSAVRCRRRVLGWVLTSVLSVVSVAACSSGDGDQLGSSPEPTDSSASLTVASTATVASTGTSSAPVASTTATGSKPSEPELVESVPMGAQPEGFSTVTARITEADGEVCDVCLWLADTSDERGRGLMGVDDLGDAAGMAFVFDQPFLGAFYMFQTPTPLSIAWFGADGAWVGSADMAPCLDTPAADCPRYQPDEEYDLAIEVFTGDAGGGSGEALEALGLGPGAVVELLAGSEGLECQTPAS